VYRGIVVEQGDLLRNQGLHREQQVIAVIVENQRFCKPQLLGSREPGEVVRPRRNAEGPQVGAVGRL
jgi:hypothetical protein